MKVNVTEKQVFITEEGQVNQGEYAVNQCEFILPECFEGLSVTAVFNDIHVPLVDSKCYIPSLEKGNCSLGVYAYRQNENEPEIIYSPKPDKFPVSEGSFRNNFKDEDVPDLSQLDLFCEQLREYWKKIIDSNTLSEYSEDATENQYYSAKAVNEILDTLIMGLLDMLREDINALKTELQGDVDQVSALVGGGE